MKRRFSKILLPAIACHLLYHLDSGMFTVVKYDGADMKFLATGSAG